MESKVVIRKALPIDAEHMVAHMRQADRREIWASGRHTADEVARLCVTEYECSCVEIDGKPAIFFGCSAQEDYAIPYMLATDDITKIGVRFILGSRPIVQEWIEKYKLLTNFIHAKNEVSMRWLGWLGFKVKQSAIFNDELFYRFELKEEENMCDPVTASMVLSAAGTMGTAYSQSQSYKAQAGIAEQNAKLAEAQVAETERLKQQQLSEINEEKRQVIGGQRAAMAASGTDSSMGSGLSELTDTAYLAKKDLDETEFNASQREWGYQMEANNYRTQAASLKASGKNAIISGILSATGQALAGMGPKASAQQASVGNNFVDTNFAPQYNPSTSYKRGFKTRF